MFRLLQKDFDNVFVFSILKRSQIARVFYYQEKQHKDHQAEVEKVRLQAEENVTKLKKADEERAKEYEEKLRTSSEKLVELSAEKVSVNHCPCTKSRWIK